MTAILVAMLSVAAKDAFGVLSTIAMARGRALISGGLDVGYEAAFIFTAAFGAGPVIKNGLTPHSLVVIIAILATAFFTATISTRFGSKMRSENDRPTSRAARGPRGYNGAASDLDPRATVMAQTAIQRCHRRR